jgi:PAS domain S-box-containing protein
MRRLQCQATLRPATWLLFWAALLALTAPALVARQADHQPQKQVLVLYGGRQEQPAFAVLDRGYRRLLGEGLPDGLDYYSELIDVARFDDHALSESLVRKYRGHRFELVIANGGTAMEYAAKFGPQLFPGASVVFNGVDARSVPSSTGFSYAFGMKGTLDLALRLQPDTRSVIVVSGASDYDRVYQNAFREQVPTAPDGVALTYLFGRPLRELTETLANLPSRSIIVMLSMTEDGAGHRFVGPEVLEQLAPVANAPIYSWNGAALGRGAVGGRMVSFDRVMEATAVLALRVLHGEAAATIPIATIDANADQVDWRQLSRWNISEARVPRGATVLFREPSLLVQYRGYIIATIALLVLQTALIGGLLIQGKRRRRAEESLRESEERFRVMADTAPVMIWRAGVDQRADFFNQPWLDFRGRTMAQELGEGWTEGLHPDDRERRLTASADAFARREPFRLEYRLRRADGEYRWALDTGVVRQAPDGTFLGYIGSSIDITERKHAEEASRASEAALRRSHEQIQDLAGRLITAQEAERARIARELHDDISQQLAGLSLEMSTVKRRPDAQQNPELLEALALLQHRTIGLAEDIRHLSHDLHPSVLRHAGLADALRSHCGEFAKRHGIDVVVRSETDLGHIDLATALCLYRVAQEALRNAGKHAAARHVRLEVSRRGDEVQLYVADDGKGFDLPEVRQSAHGLGLRSIEERVRLARGHVSIETAPARGTRVSVRLALERPAVGAAASVL